MVEDNRTQVPGSAQVRADHRGPQGRLQAALVIAATAVVCCVPAQGIAANGPAAIAKRNSAGPGGKRPYPPTSVAVEVKQGVAAVGVLKRMREWLGHALRSCARDEYGVSARFVLALRFDAACCVTESAVVEGNEDGRRIGKCVAQRARQPFDRTRTGAGGVRVTGVVGPR